MPYVKKDKLGPERARLRDEYPGLNIVYNRHDKNLPVEQRRSMVYFKGVRLPDPFKDRPAFREAYMAAKRGEPLPATDKEPVRRWRDGTWNAAIADWQATDGWLSLAANTKRLYRPFIEDLQDTFGQQLMRQTDPWALYQMHDMVVQRNGRVQANTFRSVLGNIVEIANIHGWVRADVNLMRGIKLQEIDRTSHRPYEEAEVERWRQKHALGTTARAAFEIAYNMGLGTSDLIRLAPCHIDQDGNVSIARKKTGTEQTNNIYTNPALREVFELLPSPATPTTPFLHNQHGKPFAEDGSTFRKQWRRWAVEADNPADFTVHGGRSSIVTEMIDAGVVNTDGMRITGHLDERVYRRVYGAKSSAQKGAARAQSILVAARARKGNPGKPNLRAVG